jgi:hypothetical protein
MPGEPQAPERSRPRVLVLTARQWYRHLSHTIVLDFEDAMSTVADVDWHHLPDDALSSRPLVSRPRVAGEDGEYDLALLVAMNPGWLRALRGARGLRRVARSVAVYVYDAWPYQLRSLRRWRRQVSQVDHLFLSFPEAVPLYGPRVRCPVHHLPQAASPARFHPNRPERPIDVLSIGRRHDPAHRRLIDLAEREDLLYVFADRDTSDAIDLDDSRFLTGELASAARTHVSWAVEFTAPDRAAGFSPVTARWFESAASGAVVLGRRPGTAEFDELFPYERFVVDLDPAGDAFDETVLHAARGLADTRDRLALAEHVHREHSWERRCEQILATALT